MGLCYRVNLNTVRNLLRSLPGERRSVETRRCVKMLLVPKQSAQPISDSMVPDYLVADDMLARFLEISPPIASIIPEFQEIIDEIEKAYVAGNFFSAVSAACVSIERLLNLARIELHKYHPGKKKLRNKGPVNKWDPNIDALQSWGYLDQDFAKELADIYENIRCKYLHSGEIRSMAGDALVSVAAAYKLLRVFLGFPEGLFRFTSGIECLDEQDPRFKAFYLPNIDCEEDRKQTPAT